MKRLVVPTLALMAGFLAAPAAAQAPAPRVGLLAGVNFARFTGEDAEETDGRTAFLGGAFAEFGLGRNFAIRPELLYAQKGATGDEDGVDLAFKLGYIQVPLLAQYTLGSPGAGARPHVYLGPAIGFKVSCSLGGEGGGVSVDIGCDELDGAVDVKGTDIGGIAGIGADIRNVQVGLRYEMGFTNIIDAPDEPSIKNGVLSLYVGYAFRLR